MVKGGNHILTKDNFDEIVAPYRDDMIVQRAGLIHGSLLFLKMGKDAKSLNLHRLQLTIEALNWSLQAHNSEITNSVAVTREIAESIVAEMMIGALFQDFHIDGDKRTVTLKFGTETSFILSYNNSSEGYDRLFSLYLPNRQSIVLKQSKFPQLTIEIGGQEKLN